MLNMKCSLTTASCTVAVQANYNNCSEVDLESVDEVEVSAEDSVDMDRVALHKRPREELLASVGATALLSVENASSGVSSSSRALHAESEVILALNTATDSINAVVGQLAKVAERQAEAAERLAAMQLPSHQHQQQQWSIALQQMYWRGQHQLQQHVSWQQHCFHLQRQIYWQHHPSQWFLMQ
jgi:methyl-accepting chemotaxis protein